VITIPDRRRQHALVIASGAYVAASLVANVMSVRLVRIAGFSIDAGTLIYPLTFTLRDVVHKVGGARLARVTIVTAAAMNVMMAVAFWAAANLPADPQAGPQEQFGQVLVSTWRIVLASILAQVVAELIDTEVYRRIRARLGVRHQWARVLGSNAVSIPVDSVIFVLVAFWGVVPGGVLRSIIWANIVVKGLTSMLSWPLIYSVREAPDADEDVGLVSGGRPGAHDAVAPGNR